MRKSRRAYAKKTKGIFAKIQARPSQKLFAGGRFWGFVF